MSTAVLTLSDLAETLQYGINRPAYGYEIDIHMPIVITKAADGSYGFFDPPDEEDALGSYDYRVLRASLWRFYNFQKIMINSFMRNVSGGRAVNFLLQLGEEATGFFPGGPDWYDNGDFTVCELKREQAGQQMRPFRWYEDTISLVVVSHTGGTNNYLPKNQGGMMIGGIETGFMYPQQGFKPVSWYAVQTQLLMTGTPSSINGPLAGDSWEVSFDVLCNTRNAMDLINQLVSVTRTDDLTITVPDHFEPFGIDKTSYNMFTCKFLGSSRSDKEIVLTVKHIGHDQFLIPLTFWMKGAG